MRSRRWSALRECDRARSIRSRCSAHSCGDGLARDLLRAFGQLDRPRVGTIEPGRVRSLSREAPATRILVVFEEPATKRMRPAAGLATIVRPEVGLAAELRLQLRGNAGALDLHARCVLIDALQVGRRQLDLQ